MCMCDISTTPLILVSWTCQLLNICHFKMQQPFDFLLLKASFPKTANSISHTQTHIRQLHSWKKKSMGKKIQELNSTWTFSRASYNLIDLPQHKEEKKLKLFFFKRNPQNFKASLLWKMQGFGWISPSLIAGVYASLDLQLPYLSHDKSPSVVGLWKLPYLLGWHQRDSTKLSHAVPSHQQKGNYSAYTTEKYQGDLPINSLQDATAVRGYPYFAQHSAF